MNESTLPYVSWDTCEIAKSQAEELRAQDPALSEDAAFEQALADEDHYRETWEFLCSDLTEKMNEINPGGRWYCEAEGLGWRRLSGSKVFDADEGEALLHAVLPRTECAFQIFAEDESLRIVNSHHDAMGEVYRLRAARDDEE